jgi:hypothetical protein
MLVLPTPPLPLVTEITRVFDMRLFVDLSGPSVLRLAALSANWMTLFEENFDVI